MADKPILMTGGLSRSQQLINTIVQFTGLEVKTCPHALFAGAIGACIHAMKKEKN